METGVNTRLWVAFTVVTLLAVCPARSFAQPTSDLKAQVDAIVSKPIKANEIVGLMIGVIIKGGQPQTFAYGKVAKGPGATPSVSTVFQIGSITKTFTAVLLAVFVERDLVRFNDPLQKYVPQGIQVPSYNDRQITLVNLATHTSALPRNPTPGKRRQLTADAMYQLLANTRLTREPGQRYEYSNWAFGLLGDALVKVAKTDDYQALVKGEVLSKLGMGETTLRLTPDQESKLAQGYGSKGYPAPHVWPVLDGSGALHSTMSDMLKYLSFNLGLMQTGLNSILSTVHQPRAQGRSSNHRVGLAWETIDEPKLNVAIVGKSGATPGFQTYIGFVAGKQTGVVVLANSYASKSALLGRQILTFLTGNNQNEASRVEPEPGDDNDDS